MNRLNKIFAVLVFSSLFALVSAQSPFDTLAGPLPKLIKNSGRPYLISADIEVPFGKSVTIEPGTVFLFQNFTGFKIQGQLIAEGTEEKPIVFTSEFDGQYLPDSTQLANPFDWNGIYIHKDGFGSRFKHCTIAYTVYGIKSDTRLLLLDPCFFKDNGKSNLSLSDSVLTISEETPFTYNLSARDAVLEGISIKTVEDPLGSKRRFFRTGGVLSFLAGTGGAVYGFIRYDKSSAYFASMQKDDPSVTREHVESEFYDAKTDRNLDFALTAGTTLIAILGAVGFTASFTF